MQQPDEHTPFPVWIRKRLRTATGYHKTGRILDDLGLQTICTNARCPNQGECWAAGTATVLILGTICTRNCPFCSVAHGKPEPPDPTEPGRVAQMVQRLNLSYLVITSVDRDDLADGGASQFADTMAACRAVKPDMRFEILVPDFKGCLDQALSILEPHMPFVFSHNIETVPELYAVARPGGSYERSLDVLRTAHARWPLLPVKSSMMLGLGETEEQVRKVLGDLRHAGCDRLCLGQYLQPDRQSLAVQEFVTPERFNQWRTEAFSMGFSWVVAEPFARSSYHAGKEMAPDLV